MGDPIYGFDKQFYKIFSNRLKIRLHQEMLKISTWKSIKSETKLPHIHKNIALV